MSDIPFSTLFDAFKYLQEYWGKDKEKLGSYLDKIVASIEEVTGIWSVKYSNLRGSRTASFHQDPNDR